MASSRPTRYPSGIEVQHDELIIKKADGTTFSLGEDHIALKADVAQLKASGGGGTDLTEIRADIAALKNPVSCSISTSAATSLETGATLGSTVINYTITNVSYVTAAAIVNAADNTVVQTIATPAASGSVTINPGVVNNSPASAGYKLELTTAGGKKYSSTITFNWLYPAFYGNLNATTINATQILALTKRLQSSPSSAGTYVIVAATGYKWVVVPENWTITSCKDESGLDFVLADNPAIVSVTSNGVTKNYKAYRSYAPTAASVTLTIGGSVA